MGTDAVYLIAGGNVNRSKHDTPIPSTFDVGNTIYNGALF